VIGLARGFALRLASVCLCERETSMRILLWILGVLVGLVVLVALVGMMLPKGHVARRSMTLHQSPDSVWKVLVDFQNQPLWRKDVKSVVLVSDGPGGAIWKEVGSNTLSMQTTDSQAPHRLVRTIADKDLPFGGRWIYELEPDGQGTLVTITEEGEVYNPIFRFVGRFFLDQSATITGYLTALAARFGEMVVVR
jgi:Polyketide cyclase / dehydrase and lipid transport